MSPRAAILADPAFFSHLGRTGSTIFGIMPVAFDKAFRLSLDVATRQYHCNCHLKTRPCLHIQALQILWENQAHLFPNEASAREQIPAATPNPEPEPDRFGQRLQKAEQGLHELELWLHDAVARGIAASASEDPRFPEIIAGRLSDASLGGVSRAFRQLTALPADRPDWSERYAAVLAEAYLLIRAFRRRESLAKPAQFDLMQALGISLKKEEVVALGRHVSDHWLVAGITVETVEERLEARRTWLLGTRANFAMILEFAFGDAGFGPGFQTGATLNGTLAYYPSAVPLRALPVDQLEAANANPPNLQGLPDWKAFRALAAGQWGAFPWLDKIPFLIQNATPVRRDDAFFLADADGQALPVKGAASRQWTLLALSGGHPCTVFGLFDGNAVETVSVLHNSSLVNLP